jgi:hypothetical protein
MDPLEMPLPDRRSPTRNLARDAAPPGARCSVTGEHLLPVLVTAALNLGPRWGYFSLLPLSAGLDHAYGNLALLFGVAAAVVGSVTFGRAEFRFDIPAFVGTAGAGLVTMTPFILARAGLTLGVAPRHFDILTTFAYVAFFAVVGLLVGGCWSVVMRAIRDADESHSPQQPGTRHGRWD